MGEGGKKKKHFDVQVHFVLRHGQYIFSHSLDTLHVLKRVARRLCRSVQPPSLQIKTCADKNRSSGRQASPTHPSILPIRASPSACLVCRVLLKGTLTEVLKWRRSPFFFPSSQFSFTWQSTRLQGPHGMMREINDFSRKELHSSNYFISFPCFFLIIILHNRHLSVSRRFLFHCDAKRKSPCHYVN